MNECFRATWFPLEIMQVYNHTKVNTNLRECQGFPRSVIYSISKYVKFNLTVECAMH